MKRTVSISAIVLFALMGWAQYDCDDYHKYNCPRSADRKFSLNGQSKSAMVQIGVPTELNVIVYRGQDYRISLCSEKGIVGENVHFQILQKERVPVEEKKLETTFEEILDENGEPTGEMKEVVKTVTQRTFKDETKVLFDNAENDMVQEIEFSITSTKRIMVRVIASGPEKERKKQIEDPMDIGCIGILIEHMPSPELGF